MVLGTQSFEIPQVNVTFYMQQKDCNVSAHNQHGLKT